MKISKMVKDTVKDELEAIDEIKKEVGTKELLKEFGKRAITITETIALAIIIAKTAITITETIALPIIIAKEMK